MSFGLLDRKPAAAPMSDINMTPLIDVMLVLVVILIITAPLLASSIHLDLPRSAAARPGDAPKVAAVVIDAEGRVYWQDRLVTLDELTRQLVPLAAQDAELRLRADRRVSYGRIVDVIGAARQAGLGRMAFVADPLPVDASGAGKP